MQATARFIVTAAVIIGLIAFLSYLSNLPSPPRTAFSATPVPTPQNGTAWRYFAGTPLSHYQQGNRVLWSTDTVTLYPRRDGNLKTTAISREQF